MQTLWLYLHFPNLQLDKLLQQIPEGVTNSKNTDEHTQAYVILDENANHIRQLNQNAYQAGIRLGMGLGTAAMLKADIQVISYQEKVTQSMLKNIAQHLYLVTSDICFFAPEGLLLRVHNMLNLYGSLTNYWQIIAHQLKDQKVHFHYATGHSPLAAKLLATTAWDNITDDIGVIKKAIDNTPLQHAELPLKFIDKLKRIGICNIHGLLNIPLSDIAKRFDSDVATYVTRLTAKVPHPVEFTHPEPRFEHYIELLYDVENTQILSPLLKTLLVSLEQFLKARDRLTQTLNITLYQRDTSHVELKIHSQQGEYLSTTWLRLTSLQLEHVVLIAPIFAISLAVKETYIRAPDSPSLFAGKQGNLSRLQLVSLLQTKLGEKAVQFPKLTNDFRPEHTLQLSGTPIQAKQEINLYAMRPSLLLEPPQRLQEKVTILYGPERVKTGWWDNQQITRDYFIAQNTTGQWYWVFKTPTGHWFLQGIFS